VDDPKAGPRSSVRSPAIAHAAQHPAGTATRARPPRPIRFTPSRTEPIPAPATPHAAAETSPLIGRLAVWTLIAIGWAIFIAWWVIVLRQESMRSFGVALGLLAATVLVSALATSLWTHHNMRIARRGKRGLSSMYIPVTWERDTLGRPLELPPMAIARTAREVRVVMNGNAKAYVVPDAEEL